MLTAGISWQCAHSRLRRRNRTQILVNSHQVVLVDVAESRGRSSSSCKHCSRKPLTLNRFTTVVYNYLYTSETLVPEYGYNGKCTGSRNVQIESWVPNSF